MRHRRTLLALASLTALVLPLAVASPASAGGGSREEFRVLPYLQSPSESGIRVTWFTEDGEPGTLTVRGPGVQGSRTYHVGGTTQPELAYTDAERAEQIPGLDQGSWLRGPHNYKHTELVGGLRAGHRYQYTVRQGRSTVSGRFATAPSARNWNHLRLIAMSDSETEPRGRVQKREWAPGAGADGRPSAASGSAWDQVHGTTTLSGSQVLRYPLTEDEGLRRNLAAVQQRQPDAVLFTGDLVQGGGYQPGWDEFFRNTAGVNGNLLSSVPILPAFGNWESFGALNGGYGTPEDRTPVVRSRAKFHAYFDSPGNGTERYQDNYYRVDYGPVTILTLDSNNGEPDDAAANYAPEEKLTGREYTGPGTDTQENFTREQYERAGGDDIAAYNPGSVQWNWVERQLADARARGQAVLVQFHHVPYSSGEHGLPMNHALTSGQGGTPMRVYSPLFERYGVAAVISGHSEMFERSFVDSDGDGVGVHYYDVGVSGDGLRGVRREGSTLDSAPLEYNQYSRWTADQSEPERWTSGRDGEPRLVGGGKHYGHLEINVDRVRGDRNRTARITLTPVHLFPVLDQDLEVVRTERRTYDDEVVIDIGRRGTPVR
ncbi:metallophosphoesterase [Actinophytocola xinjiangensis]|uniref:Metallophosphoesterase n=1 Tax=Actinophytocola xinjiangensis TaxID=485602 RepID=A0A7Z0WR86_9PSEU|nr:metallophosphoesterase [Actinophytocola xinjiangensis]OLF13878.1 metallophosphoesterase [Actinophytocola xinjiangensis]